MADDLRIKTDWPTHWKTLGLIRRCGADAPRCLIRLWATAADNRPDGDLSGMADEAIADAAGWPVTEPVDRFVQALVDLRWIDGSPGCYRLHDWAEHQPWVAERAARKQKARNLAMCRWHADRKPTECADDAARNAARITRRNAPNPTQPNPTQDRIISTPSGSHPDNEVAGAPAVRVPTAHLVEEWNRIAASAGAVRCRVFAEASKINMRSRWIESGRDDGERLAMFLAQYTAVAASPLCTGRLDGKGGARAWRAGLDWLVKPTNWAKVANGNYAASPAREGSAVRLARRLGILDEDTGELNDD